MALPDFPGDPSVDLESGPPILHIRLRDRRDLDAAAADLAEHPAVHHVERHGRPVCAHCGEHAYTDSPMLVAHVWEAVAAPGERFLHGRCAEARLGRDLTLDDLAPVPMNEDIRRWYLRGLRHAAEDRRR